MTAPVAQSALQQLLDLAEATRPDLDRKVIEGVLTDRAYDRHSWAVLMVHTVRMLAQGGDVRDLKYALADPTKTRRP